MRLGAGSDRVTGLVALRRSLFLVSWPFFIPYLLLPVYGMVVARALQGVSSAFVWLTTYTIVADVSDDKARASAFGSVAQASSQGSVVDALVGFALLNAGLSLAGERVQVGSWQVLFLGYGLASLAAMLVAVWRLPETKPRTPLASTPPESAGRPISWSRTWLLLLLVTLVTGASWAMVSPVLIVFLQDSLNLGIETLAWAFMPAGLVWAFLPTYLGRLADRFGRKSMMILGW